MWLSGLLIAGGSLYGIQHILRFRGQMTTFEIKNTEEDVSYDAEMEKSKIPFVWRLGVQFAEDEYYEWYSISHRLNKDKLREEAVMDIAEFIEEEKRQQSEKK